MNHFLSNFKTSVPALIMILGLLVLLGLLATKRLDPSGFSVAAASLGGACTFLIGMGAKDADK